ncbi:MAG: MFS transporter [Candidatus Omnitrophica bacterium]|nr:MFS transporter [Candidatus Omnitrophota bacterium]
MGRFRDILRDKNFVCFWLGQVISQFGDRLNQMALIALVYRAAGGSPIALAKVMSWTIIPSFFFSPFAGAYADRWDRRKTMIATDLIRAVLVALIPLFFWKTGAVLPVYILVFGVFTASCFFLPSKLSFIPDLVPREQLLIANSLTNTTMLLAAVLGVGIGGPLIDAIGSDCGFFLDSATYVGSAILLAAIRTPPAVRPPAAEPRAPLRSGYVIALLRDIAAGFAYVCAQPQIRSIFVTIFLLLGAAGALYTAGVVFIQKAFGSVTRDLGILAIALGAGFFVGAVACGRLAANIGRMRLMSGALVLSGIFLLAFVGVVAYRGAWQLAYMCCFLLGGAVGPVFIAGNTLIHELIPEQMRGRIFSILGIVMNAGFLAAMFLAAHSAAFFSPETVIAGIAVALSGYGAIGMMRGRAAPPPATPAVR